MSGSLTFLAHETVILNSSNLARVRHIKHCAVTRDTACFLSDQPSAFTFVFTTAGRGDRTTVSVKLFIVFCFLLENWRVDESPFRYQRYPVWVVTHLPRHA